MPGLVEANSLANIETLGRELSMDVMYGEANSPACVAWLSRLRIPLSTNHRLAEVASDLIPLRAGSGELAAPRRQSLLRSQARCALLPAATPRVRATAYQTSVVAEPRFARRRQQEGDLA